MNDEGFVEGLDPESRAARIYEEGQSLGFLGPGPVQPHVTHAKRYAQPLLSVLEASTQAGDAPPSGDSMSVRVLDLGSGGGVPGLFLALSMPSVQFSLLDAMEKRCAFLEQVVETYEMANVEVLRGRAEELGRLESLRERYVAVVARSFGPPAVLAECATAFLRVGGCLLVSEPPDAPQRWDKLGLSQLSLEMTPSIAEPDFHLAVLRKVSQVDRRWPRRVGIPAKRPLF